MYVAVRQCGARAIAKLLYDDDKVFGNLTFEMNLQNIIRQTPIPMRSAEHINELPHADKMMKRSF